MQLSIESSNGLSRRNLLRHGLTPIRETLRQTAGQTIGPGVMASLSEYMGNAAARPISDEAIERTKQVGKGNLLHIHGAARAEKPHHDEKGDDDAGCDPDRSSSEGLTKQHVFSL